jgi:pimeloyl-ACP methyl ester carboxylesterase
MTVMPAINDALALLANRRRQAALLIGGAELRLLHQLVRRASGVRLDSCGSDTLRLDFVRRDRSSNHIPLLGIHGFGGDKETWLLMGALLPRRLSMYFVDLPGHGTSSTPTTPASIRCHAEAVIRLMDHVGIERAILCGNSMGGGVALRIATSWPQRVAGLILIDSVGDDIHQSVVARSWITGDNPLIPSLDQIDAFMKVVLEQPLPVPSNVVRYVATQRALQADRLRRLYRDFISCDGADGVPTDSSVINVPTLVLHGEQDRVIGRRVSEKLAASITGSELHIMRGVGHAPQLEAPKATAALLARFMERLHAADLRRGRDQVR